MIVDTMTSEELYREIEKEMNKAAMVRAKRKALHNVPSNRAKSIIKKDNHLYLFPLEKSKGEFIDFYTLPFSFGKRSFNKYGRQFTFGIFANYKGREYCFSSSDYGVVYAMSMHAVRRYILRAKNPTIKTNDHKKIAFSLMLFMQSFPYSPDNRKFFAVIPDGVLLGVEEEGLCVIRTFISFEMLREYQRPMASKLISNAIVNLSCIEDPLVVIARDYFLIKFYETQESLDLV